jgi:hypothetical protein
MLPVALPTQSGIDGNPGNYASIALAPPMIAIAAATTVTWNPRELH